MKIIKYIMLVFLLQSFIFCKKSQNKVNQKIIELTDQAQSQSKEKITTELKKIQKEAKQPEVEEKAIESKQIKAPAVNKEINVPDFPTEIPKRFNYKFKHVNKVKIKKITVSEPLVVNTLKSYNENYSVLGLAMNAKVPDPDQMDAFLHIESEMTQKCERIALKNKWYVDVIDVNGGMDITGPLFKGPVSKAEKKKLRNDLSKYNLGILCQFFSSPKNGGKIPFSGYDD